MMRNSPLDVGLQLHCKDLGDITDRDHPDNDHSPSFVPSIMRNAVSTRGFIATVLRRATPAEISAALEVPVSTVSDIWLAGVLGPPLTPAPPLPEHGVLRWCPPAGEATVTIPAAAATESLSMAPPLQRATAHSTRQFAEKLIQKLERRLGRRQRNLQEPKHNGSSASGALSTRRCGFSATAHHEQLELLFEGMAIAKMRPGLYKTALGATPMRAPARHIYFEVHVSSDADAGGVCIGVAPPDTLLNKLIGSDKRSVGMHSSGQLVRAGASFFSYGKPYRAGDRVGCLVSFCLRASGAIPPPASMAGSYGATAVGLLQHPAHDAIELTFFVNGSRQPTVTVPVWHNVPESQRILHPAVSLYRDGSKAVLHCCEADWSTDKVCLLEHPDAVHSVCGN